MFIRIGRRTREDYMRQDKELSININGRRSASLLDVVGNILSFRFNLTASVNVEELNVDVALTLFGLGLCLNIDIDWGVVNYAGGMANIETQLGTAVIDIVKYFKGHNDEVD